MAQVHKLEVEAEIKSCPDKLFDVYKNKAYLMPQICPDKIHSIQVLESDGKSVGSVRLWTYVMGVSVIAKDRIGAVDEERRSITFEVVGGDVTNYFNNFKATLEVLISDDQNNNNHNYKVKWRLEYEKASEDVADPHSHLHFLLNISAQIDDYLFKNHTD
ncbi:MLP-like protein 43 [Andrographis paniculata]|uniref:MLP-like protein 43 n=1 Tax=Andrographis paniculata TaxID=175694 RepID=UPI0021E72AAC|nr:MLP-like protein 43 [Andrographis paniculata]